MNQFLSCVISNSLTLMEFVVLSVLEFKKMDFRHNFVLRCIACCSFGVFLTVLFSFLEGLGYVSSTSTISILLDASFYFLLIISCVFLLSASNTTRLFAATIILLGEQSLKVVLSFLENVCLSAGLYFDNYVYWVMEAFLFTLDVIYLYEVFIKNYRGRTEQISPKFVHIYLTLFILITILFEFTSLFLQNKPVRFLLILSTIHFLYLVLMTSFLMTMMKQEENNTNISILKQMWNEDKKQYQIQKESMEIINLKCHDLKHRIQNLKEVGVDGSNSKGAQELLKQLESNIDIYGSIIKTGNDALDVILSNVALRAAKKGIQLTSMVDGKCISFLEEGDTYSLFENMLDNALEYLNAIEEKDKCFISLTVKRAGKMAHVHCENYYSGGVIPSIRDGRLMTSKKDKKNHGYGIRSMEQIAYKYNGQFDVYIADDMFQIDVMIPLPEENI